MSVYLLKGGDGMSEKYLSTGRMLNSNPMNQARIV